MGAFLSVGKGSTEPSVFLEMKYFGGEKKDSSPLVFVGKGKARCLLNCKTLVTSVSNILSFGINQTQITSFISSAFLSYSKLDILTTILIHNNFLCIISQTK